MSADQQDRPPLPSPSRLPAWCPRAPASPPCSVLLAPQVEAVKLGLVESGVTPFEFSTITVADSMSMNHAGTRYSRVSRDIIADSIDAVARAHA